MATQCSANCIRVQPRLLQTAIVVVGLVCPACTTTQATQEHREKLRSLASTTAAVSEAWLDGRVSQRYARAAFRRTYVLVGQERDEIEKSPHAVIDANGRRLSDASAQLTRTIAVLIEGVSAGDADVVRQAAEDIVPVLAESR